MNFFKTSHFLFFLFFYFFYSTSQLQANSQNYEESKAKEFWHYQLMSECNMDRIQKWNVPPISTQYPQVTDIQIIHNFTDTGANLAYIAYNPETNIIFISVRGSHNSTNDEEDADFFMTSYENCEDCSVHEGFYHAYLDLKVVLLDMFVQMTKKYPNAQTAIFGHSLGGAIGTFAFLDLIPIIKINYFYTFGSPRVGNEAFATFCRGNLEKSNTARIVHFKDNVPHLPFSFLGFQHIDGEVFYSNEESSQFVVCQREGEDPNCSNQFNFFETDGDDHGKYMDLTMNDLSCQ